MAATLAVLLPGCSRIQEDAPAGDGLQPLRFTASVGGYATKATDIAFEEADAVSLYAYGPENHYNVKMVYDGQSLVPETQIMWASWQYMEDPTEFWAFYPYMERIADYEGQRFSVRTNQSNHQGFTQSDFMTAYTQSAPVDGTVHLHFVHRLSKLLVYVDNSLEGVTVEEAYLGGIYPEVMVTREGETLMASDSQCSIKMGQVTDKEGKVAYACIVPPQYTEPVITLVGSDGKYYTYSLRENVYFNPGCRHSAFVDLDPETVSVEFSKDVEEWVDNGDVNYIDPSTMAWSIIGELQGDYWGRDIKMERIGDIFWAPIYARNGEEFKFRADYDWTYNFGSKGYDGGFGFYSLEQDGPNIIVQNEDVYSVTLYPGNGMMDIEKASETLELSLVGSIYGSDWSTDFPMDAIMLQNGEGAGFPVFCYIGLEYKAGQEFKIRYHGEWDLNYGNASNEPVKEYCDLQRDWYNITLGQGSGVYDLYFDWYHKVLHVERTGDLPVGEITIGEVLNGEDGETYTVTGTVTGIANIAYGNYYLEDETGELYIYGTKNSEGLYPNQAEGGWYTEDFGFVYGDVITVRGPRTDYNGTIELVDVEVVEVVSRAPVGILRTANSVSYSGGTVEFMVRASAEPDVFTQYPDWASVTGFEYVGSNWYKVTVTVEANPSSEERNQIFYVDLYLSDEEQYRTGMLIIQPGTPTPDHAGTVRDPYTVSDARLVASSLSWTSNSVYDKSDPVYIKGIVTKVTSEFNSTYHNATIYISDTGEEKEELQLYRVRYLNNADYNDGDPQVAVGDVVVVYGPLMNYRNNTPETVANEAYLVSIN